MAEETAEWVEILEPETRKTLYANIATGESSWTPPPSQKYKPRSDNQWWELCDARTGRSYYHNVETGHTRWTRPEQADIVPLAKLQELQAELTDETDTDGDISQHRDNARAQSGGAAGAHQDTHSDAHHSEANSTSGQASPTQNVGEHEQASSAAASPQTPPKPPPAPAPPRSSARTDYSHVASKSPELTALKNDLNTHKRGFFRKKVSLHNMLSWSRELIPRPMLLTLSKAEKKMALDMFKCVQQYMGDRPVKGSRTSGRVLHEIITTGWAHAKLRDELFIQLCKQTTGHPSLDGAVKGWEVIIVGLAFFPPSNRMFSYIQGYIARNAESKHARIVEMADKAYIKLERIGKIGAKRGQQAPTLDEVEHAQQAITNPSVYGSTLEEVMETQALKFPDLQLPYVVKVLTDAVLQTGGATTEGIFRVPGDIDAVNVLKVAIDRGEVVSKSFSDPHVPASALKLWFRELYEPLIPDELYNACVEASGDANASIQVIDQLPPLNRLVLMYIIRFLQIVGRPENQAVSKMTYDNLSMVWAPNFLRCPSDDPMVIFNNTKREMTFVRNLVLYLPTDEVAHL